MPGLLEILEDRREVVDLLLGRVAEVLHRHLAGGLGGHAGVDEADVGVADERDAALEVAVEERGPRVELAADFLLVVTERVGVVVARDHRQPVGRARGELLLRLSRKILRNGRVALARRDARLERALLDQARDAAERGDLLDRDRDEVARRPDLVQLVVVAGHDVLRLRLRQHDLADARRVLDGELQLDPGVRRSRTPSGSAGSGRRRGRRRAACPCRPRSPCSRRSPRRRTAPRSRARRAPRALHPSRSVDGDPSGYRSCASVSFRKWSNPNSP